MEENSLVKYNGSELDKVNDSFAITNKILKLKKGLPELILIIEQTETTPSVKCDAQNATIEIKGKMSMSNLLDFETSLFEPLKEWIKAYAETQVKQTIVHIQISHITDVGLVGLLNIFKNLEWLHKKSDQLNVYWYYKEENDALLEVGKNYAEIIIIPFKITPYQIGKS